MSSCALSPSAHDECVHDLGASYVDDKASLATAESPSMCIENARCTAVIEIDTCAAQGLSCNFKVNKSNFLMHLRGKGAANVLED